MYPIGRVAYPASSQFSGGPWNPKAAAQRVEKMVMTVEQRTRAFETSEQRKTTWAKQSDGVLRYELEQEVKICFVGVAGGGKSSLLNALLGMDVVPTSGQQACTAAPMRIQYHNSSAIVAHVEFLTQQEWLDELRLLFSSLVDENGRMKSNEDMGKDGAAALQKLRVLCPSVTNDQIVEWSRDAGLFLQHNPDVHMYLGQNVCISGTDAQNFQANLAPFASSKDARRGLEPLFWPLVRIITLRCNAPAIADGAILLDLPGAGDSNRARVQVAEKWMKDCKFVFIVAPIQRAVDDKIARGESTGGCISLSTTNGYVWLNHPGVGTLLTVASIIADGRYDDHAITMIATKCDDVSAAEVMRDLRLRREPDFDALCAERDRVEAECHRYEALKAAKEDEGDHMSYPEYISHSNSKKRLDELERSIDAYCAKKRSAWTVNAVQQDFRQGLHDIDGMAAETRDPASFDPSAHNRDYSAVSITVLPCSARDYIRLKGIVPGDSKRTTFSTVDDTGVPAIISWIRELAQSGVGKRAVHKLELARGYLTSVRNFCEETSMHGDATEHSAHSYNGSFSNLDLVMQHRAEAGRHAPRTTTPAGRAPFSSSTEIGKFLYDELINMAITFAQGMRARMGNILTALLMSGADRSAEAASQAFWTLVNTMHFQTMRAAFVREGEYRNKRGEYDFNWAEIEPMQKHIAKGWSQVFNVNHVAPLAASYRIIIDQAFALLPQHVWSHPKCGAVYNSCCEQARVTFSGLSDSSSTLLGDGQRSASRELKPSVRRRLTPGYFETLDLRPKGAGIVQRQKDFFAAYVDQCKTNMFHSAGREMLQKLEKPMDELKQSLVNEMKVLAQQAGGSSHLLYCITEHMHCSSRRTCPLYGSNKTP
ncbi:uncharacterized protein SCHCODRAFT_02501309 [Schizophyllum commune H4-8]|uniref:uncharacterized protein n=1 Tax=Schizophyllum commune (strain H4-8 / FGSC 9210) TaxID=578458 RepID=UPI00215E91AD|nr:uncharacterized protein SCHCODRAFT_02501309 [Schizophyllum commune H4-8]KAI5893815.1 hypothetical protein SCHCODRAFT_02501309 [Schizophyllum commune H4-8]